MSVVLLADGPVEGVRVLTLNDPAKRNALSPALQSGLRDAVAQVRGDRSARALVVTGNGPAFSAGADLPAIFGDTDRTTGQLRDDLRGIYDSFLSVGELEIPTIAAVQGPAVGAGVILAMSCDIRIAAPIASFGVTFTKLGLHPGGGCTHYVVEALGAQRALALLLAGGAVRAEEALAAGMILEIAEDPLAAAVELAGRYAALDPSLARNIKRAVGIAGRGDFEQTLEFESWAQAESAQSAQFKAAVQSFVRK
ncbi:enoyl-CoA hydratase [Jatrophihabitans sp. GAS493]|uniref:enoyl-CoA hydratase-related protein n=1 Tax=Jatrophihabitans sp. GAS493 TaxID=1907575 RepID=UPI000BB99A69|nr:enoyl-CoA hydratase-related protein [Jatrophihabitans sp. GAS493]SOD73325.1 enoyl-CoA hydratase [Jatrophihabitans sp. GAS493]